VFNEHNCYIVKSIRSKKEFGWLVPIFGLLHLEMNLGRSFVKLNWEIFVKCAGYNLGFKSPKAMSYLYKGADHHKLWHLFEIIYSAITLELVYPYVKDCDDKGIYMQHVAMNYLHALMMLRAGKKMLTFFIGNYLLVKPCCLATTEI